MPTVLRITFPARRYHATPWGSHVNEGQVEWPPSPWRLLRALLSTGFTKLGWPPESPPPVARSLIERLATLDPSFVLPPVALAHTRHYVAAAAKRPLIFDTWAQIEEGEIEVVWPVALPEDESRLLADLAHLLGYLGRAESWVRAETANTPAGELRCIPDNGGPPGPGWESVRVLCAMGPSAYEKWRASRTASIEEAHAPAPGKKISAAKRKQLAKALSPYPRDLIAALCVETGELQSHGWSAAPGSREVLYWRRTGALTTGIPTQRRASRVETVPFALLAMSTSSRATSALPPLHRVFPQGRLLHRALGSVVGQLGGDPELARCLLGRENGSRAETDHQHAHILHLDLGGTQRLDHALIFTPMGLASSAQNAIRRLRRTYMKGGAGELQLALVGLGDAASLRRMSAPFGLALERVLGPSGGIERWRTATPYVAPRHSKKSGKDSIEGQVRLECARRGLPKLKEIHILDPAPALRHFVLHDKRHDPPWPMRYTLELVFTQPVEGPICLGYGAHVGLGRFESA